MRTLLRMRTTEKMNQKTLSDNCIKFLGTAGARYVMARQLRCSAGTFLQLGGKKLIMDPGPGTLLRCARSSPPVDVTRLDAVLLSHAHIDHSGDANALIDAMTCGGWDKRGSFFAPGDCLNGKNRILLDYLKEAPEQVVMLAENTRYELDGLQFSTSIRHRHDVETYGFRFELAGGLLSFITDTLYFDALAEAYAGSRWIVINVVRGAVHAGGGFKHMGTAEAEALIDAIKPRLAVLTHFGMTSLREKPWEMAREMTKRLSVEVRAADDGMELELEEI